MASQDQRQIKAEVHCNCPDRSTVAPVNTKGWRYPPLGAIEKLKLLSVQTTSGAGRHETAPTKVRNQRIKGSALLAQVMILGDFVHRAELHHLAEGAQGQSP